MKDSYITITVDFERIGCTDITSTNYDPKAVRDNGSCLEKSFFNCVTKNLLEATLGDCKSNKANKALKIYSYYQSLVTSVEEKNTVKVERYKEKLADLCNCTTC